MNLKSKSHMVDSGTRIADYQIWAGIHHLDSTTDYREFLPNNSPRAVSPGDELVLLDDIVPRWRVLLDWLLVCAILWVAVLVSSCV